MQLDADLIVGKVEGSVLATMAVLPAVFAQKQMPLVVVWGVLAFFAARLVRSVAGRHRH